MTLRTLCTAVLLGGIGPLALLFQPLHAQRPPTGVENDDTSAVGIPANDEDPLALEVRGRPPVPQILTVRPREELDWSRSVVARILQAAPGIFGSVPGLELVILPEEVPRQRAEPGEALDDGTNGSAAGRLETRDPLDPR